MSEPALPLPTTSALLTARDQVVEVIEAWSLNYRKATTIGHAGKVTQKYLRTQGGMAPRSIVTVIRGRNERFAGGSSTELVATFVWFFVSRGRIKDRTALGLLVMGEGVRLVTESPWLALGGSAFSRTPVAESVEFQSVYEDEDEKNGLSFWALSWRQAVDLGTAGRPKTPAAEPLAELDGTGTLDGDPNDDEFEFGVGP